MVAPRTIWFVCLGMYRAPEMLTVHGYFQKLLQQEGEQTVSTQQCLAFFNPAGRFCFECFKVKRLHVFHVRICQF